MKLGDGEALGRLTAGNHGVLATLHPDRGVDAVPCVYVVDDGFVGVPIDRVKPKSGERLQRQRNLDADPRATLLIEHWDADDWSQLWWVRAELRWQPQSHAALAERLVERFARYDEHSFHQVLTFRITRVTGWSAT